VNGTSRNPFLAYVVWKKHWNQKTEKKCHIKCWVCPEHNKVWRISSKLSSLNTEGRSKQFLSCLLRVTEKVHHTRYRRSVWHWRIGKCIRKLILASYVRTKCQVVLDIEHACTCEKEITALQLLKDNWRTVASRLQREVTRMGCCIVSDMVCSLIQSNCTELQPTINILLWVAWLFDHPAVTWSVFTACVASSSVERVLMWPLSHS
jgi:hypothetical protein